MKEVLTYRKIARKSTEGVRGVVYLHHFITGFQELVFSSHQKAQQWAHESGIVYQQPS